MLLGEWNHIVSARQFGFLLVPAKLGILSWSLPFGNSCTGFLCAKHTVIAHELIVY